MSDFLTSFRDAFNSPLFSIADTPISPSTIVGLLVVILATFWISRMARRAAERILTWRGAQPAVVGTVTALIHYTSLVVGFAVALSTAGIDLTALFAAGAIFAVGIGFAMQSIAQNFMAGVILLTERSIKPGDILEVEGTLVKVLSMGFRSSVAQSRDGEDLIIPNATLIQTTVKNFTLRDSSYRIRAIVGVSYRSDMRKVKETLWAVAREVSQKWAVKDRAPQVIMKEFGDNSVIWEVAIWMSNPWESRPALSDLHQAMWFALAERGLVIAFPQVDVHFDEPIAKALQRMGRTDAA